MPIDGRGIEFNTSVDVSNTARSHAKELDVTLTQYGQFSLGLLNFASARGFRSHITYLVAPTENVYLPSLVDIDNQDEDRRIRYNVPSRLYVQTRELAQKQNISMTERARRSYIFANFVTDKIGAEVISSTGIRFDHQRSVHGLLLFPDLRIFAHTEV